MSTDEEQNDRQEICLAEADGLDKLLIEPSGSYRLAGPVGVQQIVISYDVVLQQLKDVEKKISARIEYLNKLGRHGKCERQVSVDTTSLVAKPREISSDYILTRIGKNNSVRVNPATFMDDIFTRIRVLIDWLFTSEDAVLKHGSVELVIAKTLTKENLEHEVDVLKTRLAEKRDELTAAKMKIDELRVFKNDNIYSATSELQEKLQKMTADYKQCSRIVEEQNREIKELKESTKYLKNMLCIYESNLADKDNILLLLDSHNIDDNLESKVVNLAEKNMNLQIESTDKITQTEKLFTRHNNLQTKDLCENIGSNNNGCIVSNSTIADIHGNENDQVQLAASATLLINGDTNAHDSISDGLKPTLTNTLLEQKIALIKSMENDAERMELKVKNLQKTNETLNLEKTSLENDNRALVKNEAVLVDKFNNVVKQLEKKQETMEKLETLALQLRAGIQPLQCTKDDLEKKLSSFKDYDKTQLERIECLEETNEELKNERDHFIEICQKNLDDIKSLQQDNWTLKKELLNVEKYKSELDELKNKNVFLLNDIDSLKLDNDRLKCESENNLELRRDELIRYQNLLAVERDKKHHTDVELLKTVRDLQDRVSELQKLMYSKKESKELVAKKTFSNLDSKSTTSYPPKNTIKVLEVALKYEQEKNAENKITIENKNSEIEHLNHIKMSQEKKIADYILELKNESSINTKLQITLITLENYVKELENKLELFKAEKHHEINNENDKLKKLENDLIEVLSKNETLNKKLTEVLDIKEVTDNKLIEANRKITEFESYKKKIIVLSEELEIKNEMIKTFILQSSITERVLKNLQTRADKKNRIFEQNLLDFQNKIGNDEQKNKETVDNFEIIKKQKMANCDKIIPEENDNLKLKLEDAEKNATEWENKYGKLLNENRDIKYKFDNLNVKLKSFENYIKELENKNESYKTQKLCKKNDDDLAKIHLETVNASLTRKLAEFIQKHNKDRTHLEEIKAMITNHNLKNILQENIDLCNTRDKLQKEVFDLKFRCQDFSRKLSDKGENSRPIIGNKYVTKIEDLNHALVWQKTYLMKFARGKDELLKLIIQESPDLDKRTIIDSLTWIVYAKRKTSRFKIVVICLIALRRMKMITMKHIQPIENLIEHNIN